MENTTMPSSSASLLTPGVVPGVIPDSDQEIPLVSRRPTVDSSNSSSSSSSSRPLSPSPKYGYRKRKRDPVPDNCMKPFEKDECLICYQPSDRSDMLACCRCNEKTCTTCVMRYLKVPRKGAITVDCPFCRMTNKITNGVVLEHFANAASDQTKMTVFEPSIGIISIMGGKKLLVQRASNDESSIEQIYSATTPLVQPHLQSPDFDAIYWMDDRRALPGFECFIGVKTMKNRLPKLTIFQRQKRCIPPLRSRKMKNQVANV